ncbi:MAG TPA: PilZ domain-containing protein [Kofleriaceae bacterium]|nr:PilZ domain-containing protein [Kofleriaceae bacterium]
MMSFVPENRRNARHVVGVSVRLFLDSPQTGMRAEIVDMSAGGMRIRAPGLELEPNAQMNLRIARQDGHAAFTSARIVRTDEDGIAFSFESPTEHDRELLAMPGFWSTAEIIDLT